MLGRSITGNWVKAKEKWEWMPSESRSAFLDCKSLETMTFEACLSVAEDRKMGISEERTEKYCHSGIVGVIGKEMVSSCKSLISVTFKAESNLRAGGSRAFGGCLCLGCLSRRDALSKAHKTRQSLIIASVLSESWQLAMDAIGTASKSKRYSSFVFD
jgi:hypothetical protein